MKRLKITSVLLSAAMCMSVIATPVSLLADETTAPSESQSTEAAETKEPEATKEKLKETEKKTKETKPSETEASESSKESEPAPTEKFVAEPSKESEESEPSDKEPEESKTTDPTESGSKETEETKIPETTEPSEKAPAESEDNRDTPRESNETTVTEGEVPSQSASTPKKNATSGKCGDNLTWSLDGSTLTISGSGDMYDYKESVDVAADTPWLNYTSDIQAVVFNGKVTSIGALAFFDCENLTNITIPNSVTSIGNGAFGWCGIVNLSIPSSVTSIGEGAFGCCYNLKSVTIPNSVVSIGDQAFNNCKSLTSITIPNSVTSIGEYAFDQCENLASVTLSKNITSINERTFANCFKLSSITIPDGVTSIGDLAFLNNESLISITIPNSVTSIGYEAFFYCTSLKNVYYDGSKVEWNKISIKDGNSWLIYADNLHFANDSGECGDNLIWSYKNGTLTISGSGPMYDFWDSKNREDLTPWIKYKENGIKTVIISEGVTSIGESAFGNCFELTSVSIPSSVTEIGASAFYLCENLSSINIPDSVETIKDYAFANCVALTSFTFPNSIKTIGDGVLYETLNIKSIVIPDSCTKIGHKVFMSSGVETVTIPDCASGYYDTFDYSNISEVYYGGTSNAWQYHFSSSLENAKFHFASKSYSVSLKESPNCVATLSITTACACDEITVTVTPDEGFEFSCIKVNGETIPWQEKTFVMPAENAVVEVLVSKSKSVNTLTVKGGKTAKVKYKKLRKKKQTVSRAKMMTVSGAQGSLTYKIVSVNKKKSSFKINASTGAVTVKKKLKKGTYTLKVSVTAAGNDSYKPSTQIVTFKIKVK